MHVFSESFIAKLSHESIQFSRIRQEIAKIIVGQDEVIDQLLICILCNGHLLIEGVPGLAKTTLVKTVAQALGLSFKRIQFTPDLLPADLIGTLIYNPKTQEFETKKGPLFANIVLADEINRAPAKVQSALLESMQEHQVTIGTQTHTLDNPFFVFATQNPIEQEGTYQLPEAQLDRFLFKVVVTYPTKIQEKEMLSRVFQQHTIQQPCSHQEIMDAQEMVKQVYMSDKIVDYLINIIFATRTPETYQLSELKPLLSYGVSPRATLALSHAAKAHAFLQGRHFVIPDDVKAIAKPVLRHRIILSYEAEATNTNSDTVIARILLTIPTP